jgi:enoyl-CoA hydratase/carnithine racemase
MNEPPANSYGISFMRELDAAVDAAEGDEACRVVVVRSAVPGFFCGDADIKRKETMAFADTLAKSPTLVVAMITVPRSTAMRWVAASRSRWPAIFVLREPANIGSDCPR